MIPAYYVQSSSLALGLICFGLFAIQIKGAVFTLPTDLFPQTGWQPCGVYLAQWVVWVEALPGAAGFMIQEAGMRVHLSRAASLCGAVANLRPKIAMVAD